MTPFHSTATHVERSTVGLGANSSHLTTGHEQPLNRSQTRWPAGDC